MRKPIASRGALLAGALILLLAAGAAGAPAAAAQDRGRRFDYALIDHPEADSRGVWCPPPDSVLLSPAGPWRAVNYSRAYRGESDLLARTLLMIFEDYRLINAVVNLTAVAWGPAGEKLLVHETDFDDDAKWFILNLAEGEYDKTGPERLRTMLGTRSYEFVEWSDPQEIIFRDAFTGEERRVPVR